MSATIGARETNCDGRTIASCVLGRHETPGCGRRDCPLVRALGRRLNALRAAGADTDREVDRYQSIARVLGCPVLSSA
jgi:hypothetical protein